MSPEDALSPRAAALARIRQIVGPKGWYDTPADIAPYLAEQRGMFQGDCKLVVRPDTTADVAAVVSACASAGIAIVPQGGNTGLVGAGIPMRADAAIILSLGRMNRIRCIDPLNATITVEAGCILANIQAAAAAEDRLFPLSLSAEGSCQIGGNLSTNAGGVNVLRYGNARDLVLGLEVVLPDGRIWNKLKRLRKDNTGYDLKHLFIGAEGTLGIVTAAVMKLYPRPREISTAFVALRDARAAVTLLASAKAASGDGTTTFEYMDRTCLDLVFARDPAQQEPFGEAHGHYALIEMSAASDVMEALLGAAFESGEVLDAVIASSGAQRSALWRLRELIPESMNHAGGVIRHDVSVPVSMVPEFLDRARICARDTIDGVRIGPFGHIGDGNIHFNLVQPVGGDKAAFLARTHDIEVGIHDIATALEGSFSAEHGIGQLKRDELARYKSDIEQDQMRRIKRAFDPKGIMNPGKVL